MTDRPLREVMARGMYEDEHTGPNDTPWPELPDVHRMAFGHLADAAIAALDAAGYAVVPQFATPRMLHKGRAAMFGRIDAGEAEAIWRAMVLTARPRDAASMDKSDAT